MSLLENAFENFVIINKIMVDDGYGGVENRWVDGATIKGTIRYDNSKEGKIAQALGSKDVYTLTVKRNVLLDYHVVLRRSSDNKVFRLTSDSDDNKTPPTAGLDMRQYTVEEFELA